MLVKAIMRTIDLTWQEHKAKPLRVPKPPRDTLAVYGPYIEVKSAKFKVLDLHRQFVKAAHHWSSSVW